MMLPADGVLPSCFIAGLTGTYKTTLVPSCRASNHSQSRCVAAAVGDLREHKKKHASPVKQLLGGRPRLAAPQPYFTPTLVTPVTQQKPAGGSAAGGSGGHHKAQ